MELGDSVLRHVDPCAHFMRRGDRVTLRDIGRIELIDGGDAQEGHHAEHFVLEDFQRLEEAVLAAGAQTPSLKLADSNGIRAEGERLHDVGATHDSAVEDDPRVAPNCLGDLGERLDGALALIELAAAVVGHPHDINAVLNGELRGPPRWRPL